MYNKIYQAPLSLAGRYKAGLAGAAGIGVVGLRHSTKVFVYIDAREMKFGVSGVLKGNGGG